VRNIVVRHLFRLIQFLEQELPGIPVRLCLVITFALSMGSALLSEGYYHPDEQFQILEFTGYKLGLSPASDLAWEFPAKIRPAVQPAIAYAVFRALDRFHRANPFSVAFILRLFMAAAAWIVSLVLCIVALQWLSQSILKKTLFLLSCFFWFFPYYHCRFSSENASGIAFFAGLAIVLWTSLATNAPQSDRRARLLRFFVAGLLMGFSFFFRFQMGFAIIGIGLWLLIFKKASILELFMLLASFCISCGINIGIDRWFYGSWVITPANYFNVNIIKNVSGAEFGVSPWWFYMVQLLVNLAPPISLIFIAGFFLTVYKCPKNPLVWGTLPFFLIHCIIGHKEFRFLFPMLFALPALLVLGADSLWPFFIQRCKTRWVMTTIKMCLFYFIAVNLILLLGYSFKPGKAEMSVFKWIYKAGTAGRLSLLTLQKSPYHLGAVPINFYKSPHVSVVQAQTADSLIGLIKQSKKPVLVALQDFTVPDSLKDTTLKWKAECRSIPKWLCYFNINHWVERVHVWTIYSVSRGGSI
jgi:phosphatidylinositol glycan class B